ncbi:hypothetical protein V6N13_127037 [Hibiscus sabdariffa]
MKANPKRKKHLGSFLLFGVERVVAPSTFNVFLDFVPCSDNLVAHILAKDASLGSAGSFWVEEVPVVVRQRLLRIGVLSNPS